MFKKSKKVVVKNYKNHTKEIKAIIFDVGGVLLKGKGKSIHEYISKKLKIDMDNWFDTVEPYWEEMVKDESTTNHSLTIIAKHFNIPKYKLEKLFRKAFKKQFKKDRKMFKLLKKLRKHYKIAILSDQVQMSYEVFKRFNLDKLVDIAVWSQKEGIRKPDPEIYKLTASRLKVPAENCLFIDNRDWNLVPAKKLGMKYILFYNYKNLLTQICHLGVKI